MAVTYRYIAVATPSSVKAISKQVSPTVGSISITTPPPTMMDVELENPSADDKDNLDEYMASIGYVYMSTDPAPLENGETVVWENGAWTCVNLGPESSSSLPLETSSNSSFVEKVLHEFTCESASAKHFIMYDVTYESTSGNVQVEVHLILDDSLVLARVVDRPGGSGRQRKFTGFIQASAYGQGAHTLRLEYKKVGGSGSVKISDARVSTARVI